MVIITTYKQITVNHIQQRKADYYNSIYNQLPESTLSAFQNQADIPNLSEMFKKDLRVFLLQRYFISFIWSIPEKFDFNEEFYTFIVAAIDSISMSDVGLIDIENMSISFEQFLRNVISRQPYENFENYNSKDFRLSTAIKAKFYMISVLKSQKFEDSQNIVGLLDEIFHHSVEEIIYNPWDEDLGEFNEWIKAGVIIAQKENIMIPGPICRFTVTQSNWPVKW